MTLVIPFRVLFIVIFFVFYTFIIGILIIFTFFISFSFPFIIFFFWAGLHKDAFMGQESERSISFHSLFWCDGVQNYKIFFVFSLYFKWFKISLVTWFTHLSFSKLVSGWRRFSRRSQCVIGIQKCEYLWSFHQFHIF